ncbi:MAG: hypothetical protein MPK62_02570 [Alphaproteobacteria bacterium]|nr:hypothetical protein [Alphaproteobacteria bacterium]MDA8030016.1 hypothetical protein [Alphaproteobacteria bacterium]
MKGEDGKFFSGVDIRGMVKEAAEIADAAPDKYSQKTFEVLLSTMCQQTNETKLSDIGNSKDPSGGYKWPDEVEAFMEQCGITRNQIIEHCFRISENGKATRKYNLKRESVAKVQINIAYMNALKNALEKGCFEFSKNDVRNECKSMDRFNNRHFKKNFKNKETMFESLKNEQVSLSVLGKEKLAGLINELSNTE